MIDITRRGLLAGAALVSAAAASPSFAAVEPAKAQGPGIYRTKLGSFQLTALYDGTWFRAIDENFVRNASATEVDKALADAFLPPRIVPTSFTALLVNTGSKLVLIDTGSAGQIVASAGTLLDNLAAAGVAPKDIDTILISHFHSDHINGLRGKDGEKIFPNAEIKVAEQEWAYWLDAANLNKAPETGKGPFLNARRIFADIASQVTRFRPGAEVAPGIVSVPAFGHTPGHTAFAVASGNESVLVLGDVTNHPWLFARHPQWQGYFDVDGPLAVETRMRMLDRAAADKMLVHGYHFPFPAWSHIVRRGAGFDVAPVMWQPL